MKKYKEFRGEQQYITEVGPLLSMLTGLMGLAGAGYAGYKTAKAGIDKWKGYKETKAEKKDNQENGVFVKIKKWDEKKGKIITQSVEIAAAGSREAKMSNEDIEKERKKLQKIEDPKNDRASAAYDEDERVKGDEKDKEDTKDKEERGGIEDVKDAEDFYNNSGEKANDRSAPPGWQNVGTKTKPELMTTKDAEKEEDRRRRIKDKRAKPKPETQSKESYILKFGEYISEDVMSDLLKATKSKKDSEITLDDGTDIPIDPLTSQILVKYIEGLSSSEKNRTIQQIQRTERAFMKVLGKAHENI